MGKAIHYVVHNFWQGNAGKRLIWRSVNRDRHSHGALLHGHLATLSPHQHDLKSIFNFKSLCHC